VNLLADENVDQPVIHALRTAGHVIWAVAEQAPGLRDEDVLDRAARDGSILITADKDFGELVFRRMLVSGGVLLIRLAGVEPGKKARLVVAAIEGHGGTMTGAFSVLSSSALRVRRRS
jgi:predicted nuclease of predicted toxin-antitoxin system